MVLGKVNLFQQLAVSCEKSMEVSMSDEDSGKCSPSNENGHLEPVFPETSGEGLPYAPENFPSEGDSWRWRVGKRVAITGHYLDRYLYLPARLRNLEKEKFVKCGFASKLSVKRFVQSAFPTTDIDAFFASFSWKIPSKKLKLANAGIVDRSIFFSVPREENSEQSAIDSSAVSCKARNQACSSLTMETEKPTLAPMPCDICCSEPGFCRDCCCILCCKIIDSAYEGYSYVKCEALVGDNCICGHVAHLDCALRAYMAGTVGGSIGLDAEYYCRRCDAKTELSSHVTRLLQTCKSIDSRDDLEKVLNVSVCVLHGSKKTSSKSLLSEIYRTLAKLKRGIALEEIWKEESDSADNDNGNCSLEVSEHQDPTGVQDDPIPNESAVDARIQYLKLDYEIDQALQTFRMAQESEYRIAEEQFHAQKNHLYNIYQQLEYETSELRKRRLSSSADDLLKTISGRKDQIMREFKKLKVMKEAAAKGFGRTSKDILKEYFGLEESD